jgi:type IV pilus assembly protein PilB
MYHTSSDNKKLGQLLVHDRLITEQQLEQALTEQARQSAYKPLGEILKELGFISRRDLQNVLARYRKQIPLGELLLKLGVISREQLDEALALQKQSKQRLGLVLMEKGFVKKSRLAEAIALQLGISSATLAECQADASLLEKVNAAFLKTRRVMPLKYDKESNTVALLMEDPTDREVLTDLEKIFRATIEPVMLSDGWIEALLQDALDVWR